jgi:hypothetical protein
LWNAIEEKSNREKRQRAAKEKERQKAIMLEQIMTV